MNKIKYIFFLLLICLIQSTEDQYKPQTYEYITEIVNRQNRLKDNPLIKLLEPLLEQLKQNTLSNTTSENLSTEQITTEIQKFQNSTFKKWNLGIIDFVPDDIVSFALEQSEVLIEEIKNPTVIRGSFFTTSFEKQKVRLTIKNCNNITIFEKDAESDAFFLQFPQIGEYKFIFNNKRNNPIQVTFAIDIHNSYQDILNLEDLDPISQKIEALHMSMRDKHFYAKLFQQQYNSNLEVIQKANDKLLFFSIVEVLAIVSITLWQVYYLQRILSVEKII